MSDDLEDLKARITELKEETARKGITAQELGAILVDILKECEVVRVELNGNFSQTLTHTKDREADVTFIDPNGKSFITTYTTNPLNNNEILVRSNVPLLGYALIN